jgi:hypothetical protein
MRKAHEAAAYDKWFLTEITQALVEADDPNTQWVSNEDIKKAGLRSVRSLLNAWKKAIHDYCLAIKGNYNT